MIASTKNRKSHIIKELNSNNKVEVSKLSKLFNVSEVTIRKDLADLAERNLLIRVRGGAILMPNTSSELDLDESISNKSLQNHREKQLIGKLAASLISEKETILLDSGTTTLEIAKNLDAYQELTIITNAINIATELAKYNRFNVILLGGNLRSKSLSTVGSVAESVLKIFYCDKLFLGVDSFSLENGLSTNNIEEANINQTMISMAKKTIAVLDSSKFNKRSFAYIAPLTAIETIVTDSNISKELEKQISALGIELYVTK